MAAAPKIMLLGDLANHSRGKNLGVSFKASPAEHPPEAGTAVAFGKDFQSNPGRASDWLSWVEAPGRLFLLVPPYSIGLYEVPVDWEVRRADPLAGGGTILSWMLASERGHEFRGSLLPLERVGGFIITAGWRKHPSAGLLVWTALPLWSLSLLDQQSECAEWLATLYDMCGRPVESQRAAIPEEWQELTKPEWSMLLHLCSGFFDNGAEAIAYLRKSSIFQIPVREAESLLRQLEARGLASGGNLTETGERILNESPYAAFAHELRRQRHG